MNWQPGDAALIVVEPQYDMADVDGKICVLIEYMGDGWYKDRVKGAWSVDAGGHRCAVAEECLRKPYDGHEPCTWASVQIVTGWAPKELVPVVNRLRIKYVKVVNEQ